MVKAFVTGATGFVGSAVVRALLRRGIKVVALARRSSDLRNLAGLDVAIVYGDLLRVSDLTQALQGCVMLYHVAAYYSTSEADAQKMYEVNVGGTKAIMRAALTAGVQRVVHTSTIGTIGQPGDSRLATEKMPFDHWETSSHYARSKYLGEVAAMGMCNLGLPVVVVNPCAPVGPGDLKPSSTGQRILDYLHGKWPSFVPGGINFVAVKDVAEGHVLAAEKGRLGERYILGHKDGNLMLEDFLRLMERVSGEPMPEPRVAAGVSVVSRARSVLRLGKRAVARRTAPVRDFRPAALTCDPSKAIGELGLPQTPLDVAFAEAVAWFREHGYVDI
jgi:dihydroflavonol-4-reductase